MFILNTESALGFADMEAKRSKFSIEKTHNLKNKYIFSKIEANFSKFLEIKQICKHQNLSSNFPIEQAKCSLNIFSQNWKQDSTLLSSVKSIIDYSGNNLCENISDFPDETS